MDVTVVVALARDLGSRQEALDFLDRFQVLLTPRINRIHAALRRRDLDEAQVALHSLHSSAVMAGATQLRDTTAAILGRLTSTPPEDVADQHLPDQYTAARELARQLPPEARAFTHDYTRLRTGDSLRI